MGANNLNSVLMEGIVEEILKQADGDETVQTTEFTIVSNRYFATEGGYELKQIRTLIVTKDRLADSVNQKLAKNRGVRVVGSIDETDGKLCVVAEHVEFRPEFKKENKASGKGSKKSKKSNSTKKKQ